jgi:hypothetical protein
MKRILQTSLIAALCISSLIAIPASSDAQVIRRRIDQRRWYTPPGSSIRIFPAPRYGYRLGNMWVYPPRNQNWGHWPYGAPRGYSWPYGYSSGYRWPYGNSVPLRRDRRNRGR